jgi:hypothetical protein
VVVRAIDQDNFRGYLTERLGGSQSAKATTDYDDSRLIHLLLIFLWSFLADTDARQQCNRVSIQKPLKGREIENQNQDGRLASDEL